MQDSLNPHAGELFRMNMLDRWQKDLEETIWYLDLKLCRDKNNITRLKCI